ncbi:MAG TPA: ectoine/hydroxyectoine ABC transporter permease subunit EhuC [Acidimicrobiia bacterium]|nr:ectoine/hydroxyectoine ABC transporter permease subunit EhuC [Acidimicrobiia bacterium]
MLSGRQFGALLEGAWITVQIFVFAAVLGTILALIFGIMGLSEKRLLRAISRVYVEVARGASAIVLLFYAAFAIPIILGVRSGNTFVFVAGIIALGINMGGYGAEVVRTGIQSVPRGQTEATIALNLRVRDRLRHVILPQAFVVMIPPYGNLSIEVLKGTALVSLVGISDLTSEAQNLRVQQAIQDNRTPSLVIFGTALVIYFIFSQVLALFFRWLEKRIGGKWYGARG